MQLRALALALFAAAPAFAQPPPPTGNGEDDASPIHPDEHVELSLENADLSDLVRMMNRVTGHHIIVTGHLPDVRATIAGDAPVTAGEAYRAFLAVLHQNGLTIVSRGSYFTITTSDEIARRPTQLFDDEDRPPP